MNPFDAVGTARISGAIYDRVCRLAVTYQSASEELAIAERAVPGVDAAWAAKVVELVRLSRSHPDLRVGSSVRGAIDMCAVAPSLGAVRGQPVSVDRASSLDAALIALSGRVRLRRAAVARRRTSSPSCGRPVFGRSASGDGDGEEKLAPRLGPPALAEVAASTAEGDEADEAVEQARKRTTSRRELARNPRFEQISPDVGELDEAAIDEALSDDPDDLLAMLADLTGATDPKLRELARRIAGRLYLDIARRGPTKPRGIGPVGGAAVPTRSGRPRSRRQPRRDRRRACRR